MFYNGSYLHFLIRLEMHLIFFMKIDNLLAESIIWLYFSWFILHCFVRILKPHLWIAFVHSPSSSQSARLGSQLGSHFGRSIASIRCEFDTDVIQWEWVYRRNIKSRKWKSCRPHCSSSREGEDLPTRLERTWNRKESTFYLLFVRSLRVEC